MTDGGYYALKGFCFQYDKTLINVFNKANEKEIFIEQTEDFSTTEEIYQIKYHESTDYSNSKIKKPVCKLIEIFKMDKRKVILFAHFRNKSAAVFKPNLSELKGIIGNAIIGKKTYIFNDSLLSEFIDNFEINFADDYISQYDTLITLIEKEFNCRNDEAVIIYPQLRAYIENIVVNNSPEQVEDRTIKKEQLVEYIKNNRELIFYRSYADFIGIEKYFRLIKKKYFIEANLNPYQRFFIIDIDESYSDIDLLELSNKLIEKYAKYSKGRRKFVKSPAPHIFYRYLKKERLLKLKIALIENGRTVKDGYPIKGDYFFVKDLTIKCTVDNEISMKFIEDYQVLIRSLNEYPGATKKVYHFYLKDYDEVEFLCEKHMIGISSTSDIIQIFN